MSTPVMDPNCSAFPALLMDCNRSSSYDGKERKWQCPDIEMQKHVVHSISEFLGFISADTCQHPLVKDSVADMIKALEGILQSNSEAVLIIAAKVALKLVRDFPSSVVQSHVLHLIQPFHIYYQGLNQFNISNGWLLFKEDIVVLATSRYRVWNDAELLRVLEVICVNSDSSVKVAVLQLYSALALCGNGAERLLENGKNFIKMVVQCMDSTQPPSVRIEAFKLSQLLTITRDQISVAVEAGRLALITCWAGEHHIYFWKLGIGKVLIELRLSEFLKAQRPQDILLSEEQKSIALKDATFTCDILGGLVTLLTFVDSVRRRGQTSQYDANNINENSVARAVLMMIYSPCKYIKSQARSKLSEALKPEGKHYLKSLMDYLHYVSSRDEFGNLDERTSFSIVGLTCSSGLRRYRKYIIQSEGIKMLLAFIKQCLKSDFQLGRLIVAPDLQNMFSSRTYILLFFGLWGLAELIHHSGSVRNCPDLFHGQMEYTEAQLIHKLQEICSDTSTPGLRWYAAYLLSYFGVYGFPSRLGKRIGNALGENENADTQLILKSGESLSIHGVVLISV
ncbi:hypothetical protein AAG906_029085 [Vitis piasezkii]